MWVLQLVHFVMSVLRPVHCRHSRYVLHIGFIVLLASHIATCTQFGSGYHAKALDQPQSPTCEIQRRFVTVPYPGLASDTRRHHDQLIAESLPFLNPWISEDSREEDPIVTQLVIKAEQLQAKRDYTAAFTLLGQVLSLQLAHHDNLFASLNTQATIQRIVALLFDQYPWLARQPEAEEPYTSVELAFTKLPVNTSDLNTLLAVRAVADWCCHPREYRAALAQSLYAQLYPRMEQVVGQQHPETIRLLYHWGKCGYQEMLQSNGLWRPTPNHTVIEERCQAAILGLDKVLGRHDPDTIDCTRTLGHIYLKQEKYSEAQATFEQLYREQLTEFGAADDRTLWSLSDLAKTLTAQDGNYVRAGKLIWSAPVESRPSSWKRSDLGGGVAAYNHQNGVLAWWKAPKHFIWESKALYCLPIRHLQFRAVYPSDEEKRLLWHPSGAEDHGGEPTTFKYTFELKDDESIHLTVPYIPYSHFSTSRDFSGFTYRHYATVDAPIIAKDSDSWAAWRLRHRQVEKLEGSKHRSHRGDLPVLQPLKEGMTDTQTTSQMTGFFNDIPGDTAVMVDDIEYNLVSSDWVDYNLFTLHTTAEALTPKLKSANGSTIACHGYISGTWTDFDAEHLWSGLMVFVVDAVFSESAGSNRLHHFLLGSNLLRRASRDDLTSDDKRSLAASLNPTLLYFRPQRSQLGAGYVRSYPDLHTPLQKEYMDEMNRRQKWDRSFENRLLRGDNDFWCQLEREEEDRRRMKWDEEHIGPLTANRDGGQLPLQPPPPDIPPIDPQRQPWNPFSGWFLKLLEARK